MRKAIRTSVGLVAEYFAPTGPVVEIGASKTDSERFRECAGRFEAKVQAEFRSSRWRGMLSELKERGRDFFDFLLGRAQLQAAFFRPDERSGYRAQ